MGGLFSKPPKEQLNFLLMGKTGNGKSTLGNCILGCKTFEISADVTSHTQEVKCGYSKFQNYSLKVVDAPGLEDPQLDKVTDTQRAKKIINRALLLCYEGFDAVIFVFKFGCRLTKEEVSVIETLKNIFGQGYFSHVIVVLVGAREFKDFMADQNFKGTFHEWCESQKGPFEELYKATDKRFMFYNSFERNKKKQIAQREQLTTLAHGLKSDHGRYTAECFRLAAAVREHLILEYNMAILKENIQRAAGILFSDICEYIQTTDEENTTDIELKLAIKALKDEITNEDKDKDFLADVWKVISSVERSVIDKDKLLDHAKELEQIRTAEKYWLFAVDIVDQLPALTWK